MVVVFNPVAGGGRGALLADRLEDALSRRHVPATLVRTAPDRDVFAELDVDASRAVVVVGGDGSLNGAVNGLAQDGARIAFCGAGTVNVLTLERGVRDDPEAVADAVASARETRVPLFASGPVRGVLFLEAGFLARIVARVNRVRRERGRHGRSEFVRAALAVLPRSRGRQLHLVVEGRRHGPFSNVLLTRARRYAGSLPMPIDARLASPLEAEGFQVVAFRTRGPLGHLALLLAAALRLLPRAARLLRRVGWLETFPAARVRLEGPPDEAVHVDAETEFPGVGALRLPLEIGFDGRSIRLLG